MNKKYIWVFLLALMMILSSCKKNEPIKVGFSAGLVGVLADEGVSARNGFNLAVEEINNNGGINGRMIEAVVKDDESSVDVAKKVDQEFSDEGVNIIIGHLLSSTAPAIIEGMDKYGHIYISPTMATSTLTDKDDNFFRVIGDTDLMASAIAETIEKTGKSERIAIIYDYENFQFTNYIREKLLDNLTTTEVLLEIPFKKDSSYREVILKVKESGADGIVMINSSVAVANLIQQIAIADFDITKYATTWALSTELIYKGGRATEGLYGVGFYDKYSQDESYLKFLESYKGRFSEDPSHTSMFSYDAVYLLKKAIEESGKYDNESIRESLKNIGSFQGISDELKITEFGDCLRPYVKIQIIDGEMRKVQ
ncbi:MAG: ABC transporter substrate-binding protein [Firmicutes bacterium]|jgi:branched-chain amino acid transport system substrate-binding protein|nr:ABC transporter substrate-binding protein [Bacillota bacterium]